MHSIARSSLLLLVALTGLNAAELPKKAPLSRYSGLWTNSPFTAPPKPVDDGPVINPFEDLVLKGIAPIAGGYLITLINKKNPAETVPPIDTDRPSEYKVLSIERDPDKPLGTVVYLSRGTQTGSVTFDEKLSMPKPAAPKPANKQPGRPPVPVPPVAQPAPQIPTPAGTPSSRMRSRIVPPATGTQPGGQSSGRSGGRSGGTSGGSNYQRPGR